MPLQSKFETRQNPRQTRQHAFNPYGSLATSLRFAPAISLAGLHTLHHYKIHSKTSIPLSIENFHPFPSEERFSAWRPFIHASRLGQLPIQRH